MRDIAIRPTFRTRLNSPQENWKFD